MCNSAPNKFWNNWKKLKGSLTQPENINIDTFSAYYKNIAKFNTDPNFDKDFMLRLSEEMDKYGDGHNVPCPDIINDILNGPINMAEVQKALKAAKNKKACGSDGIPSEFLKFSNGHLDYPLVSIFNYVFDSCEYPSAWATGLINPIHKQNDTSLPENYRKISLLSSMSKVLEYILNNRLTSFKDVLKTHDPMQNGS